MSKANKANKASKPEVVDAAIEANEAVAVAASKPAIRSIAAIEADIDAAIASNDRVKLRSLYPELDKAERAEAKKHAEYVKANEAKFVEARIAFSEYIAEAVEMAIKAYTDANGDIVEALGDKLNAIRITLAGAVDKAGIAQANTSAAIQLASAKKASASGAPRTGNFNCGERGNICGSGMSASQVVEKFATDEQKAVIEAQTTSKAKSAKTYFTAKALLKANNII